jgi:hypothetical protein
MSVTTVLRVALPDAALTVTEYVPAGVPVVVVVVLDELHPCTNNISAKNPAKTSPISNRRWRERLPVSPTPTSARPETGNQLA